MAQPLALEMVPGTGELLIRDAEESYPLASPTTVSGQIDDTTGVITDLDLATPAISFEQPIEGLPFAAQVHASFASVAPGSGTGQLSPDGGLHVEASLRVDLRIEIPQLAIFADCVASPVRLALDSTTPYDEATGVVPMADADFTIPAVPVTSACSDLVADRLNPILAGAGHALELTLLGAMTIPTAGEIPSTTTLTVDPIGPVSLGQVVDLTATVASGDAQVTDAPTGNIRFLDGGRIVGQAPVEEGAATLAVSTLRLGQHQITAEYRGDDTYRPSTSAPVAVTVQADPVIEAELPGLMVLGDDPTEFDVTMDNPSAGRDIGNARVDITIQRFDPVGYSFDPLGPGDVLLEVENGDETWSPVGLTSIPGSFPSLPGVTGSLGPEVGRALEAGGSFTDRLRISFPDATTAPGPLDVTFSIVQVAPGTGEIVKELSSTTGRLSLFMAGRVQSEFLLDAGGAAVRPLSVRQQGSLVIDVIFLSVIGAATYPSGDLRVAIDGQPVPVFDGVTGDLAQPSPMTVPVDPTLGYNPLTINLPSSVGPGPHTVTVSYSGDNNFTPSSQSVQIAVVEPIGVAYECEMPIFADNKRFNVQLVTGGRLPATARPGTDVGISKFSLDTFASLNTRSFLAFDQFKNRAVDRSITIDIGPAGTGTADPTITYTPSAFPYAQPDAGPDLAVALADEQAAVTISGDPGSVVVPTIEKLTFSSTGLTGAPQVITCEPLGDPISFSPVTVAGTTLEVDAPAVVRAGEEVVLTASVFPSSASGTVRFSDGDELLDIAPVVNGRAVLSVRLPVGERSLSARFFAGVSAPSTTSEAVALRVLPELDCAGFAEDGNGATVRLVYMELLGRCPDQAGFDYWTGRLDGGTSPEVFARSIAATPEAVSRVVDDAYETMLGRPADAEGRAFWTGRLSAHGRYDTLLADLGASAEFWSQAGSTNTGFVGRVYGQLLGRSPDQAGQDYWVARLDAGTSRRALIVSLSTLEEPLGVLVAGAYDEILSRAPAAGERADGIAFLRSTGDRSGLYARLIGRPEFATRAGTFPNPED